MFCFEFEDSTKDFWLEGSTGGCLRFLVVLAAVFRGLWSAGIVSENFYILEKKYDVLME